MIELFLVPQPIDPFTGTIEVDIVAVADEPTRIHALDFGFAWNPNHLILVDSTQEYSDFNTQMALLPQDNFDFYGLNTDLNDGNAYYMWLNLLGTNQYLESGVIGTLIFQTKKFHKTKIEMIENINIDYPFQSHFYAGEIPGLDLLDGCQPAIIKTDFIPTAASI